MESLLTLSGSQLAGLIRAGQVSSREVVETHIARVLAVNGALNAVVHDRFDEARREADAADALRRSSGAEALPPFHGVPCSIKECFSLTGMPSSSGLYSRRELVSRTDATAVQRLRSAGAIPLGVTNVSELCMWMESDNRVYGRTNNAYDRRRIAGGSSGGEGAIVGAGGTPFGLGADIGGSIRMPAFFNGVFGHKPTGGLVPGTGQFPMAENAALRFNTTGPLTRRAEDLWPLLRVLAGPDGLDAGCTEMPLGDPGAVRIAGLPVVVIEENPGTPASAEMKGGLRRAAQALASAGAIVRTTKVDALRDSLQIWSASLTAAATTTFAELLGNGEPVSFTWELLKYCTGASRYTLPSLTLIAFDQLLRSNPHSGRRAAEAAELLKAELLRELGDGVLLYPPFPTVAPLHHLPLLTPFRFVYTAICNILHLPSTVVPLGLGKAGVPLGTQVIARPGADHLTIAVAQELERQLGGWVVPAQFPLPGGVGVAQSNRPAVLG